MSGGRVQAIADCMDRPRLHERHLVPVMTLARTGLFFEGFCGSAMRFCITSRQRGSAVPARITTHPEVVRVVGHSVAVKWGYEKLPAQASRPTSPDPHIVTLVLTMRLPIESTERKGHPRPNHEDMKMVWYSDAGERCGLGRREIVSGCEIKSQPS